MNDQASNLRQITNPGNDFFAKAAATRVLAVTSGKGGVGKTNVTANLAIALSKEHWRVGVLDADFGLANLDILLGLAPKRHLAHLLFGDAHLDDIILTGPSGIKIIPASSGMEKMTEMTSAERERMWVKLIPFMARVDYLLIDTAAGISSMVVDLLLRAHEILLVCSSEPTSLVDAYALIKVMEMRQPGKIFRLITNAVQSEEQGIDVFEQLNMVTGNFLHRGVDYLGPIMFDPTVPEAVRLQRAVMDYRPMCPASRSYILLARKLIHLGDVALSSKGSRNHL